MFHHSILGFSKLIFSAKLYIVNPLFQRQQIWTNCELPKNTLQKHFFQNILKNSCKNWLAKPLFMQAPRGKSRNEGRPFQGIDTSECYLQACHWCQRRNEGRPFTTIQKKRNYIFSDCALPFPLWKSFISLSEDFLPFFCYN